MHLLVGNSRVENRDHNNAIRSFERARAHIRPHTSAELLELSLAGFLPTIQHCTESDRYLWQISGWKFDNLGVTIQLQLCEAHYAAGHTKRAGETVLEIAKSFGDEMFTSNGLSKWVCGELILHPYSYRAYKTSPQISHNVASSLETARVMQPLTQLETIFLHHSPH